MSLIRYNFGAGESPYQVKLYEANGGLFPFETWFFSLKDERVKTIVRRRIARVRLGNFGDRKPVGDGVWELRIDFGPGFRIYYAMSGASLVLLLAGGDKSSQSKDIRRAISYWLDFRRRKHA